MNLKLADSSNAPVTYQGFKNLETPAGHFKLDQVLYTPKLDKDIISVSQLAKTTPILFMENSAYVLPGLTQAPTGSVEIASQRNGRYTIGSPTKTSPVRSNGLIPRKFRELDEILVHVRPALLQCITLVRP